MSGFYLGLVDRGRPSTWGLALMEPKSYPMSPCARGAQELGLDEVTGEARLRLYRASVHEYWILDPDSPFDVRVSVRP